MRFIIEKVDSARQTAGFLTIEETLALGDKGNLVLDPFSTLISKGVQFGRDNILYPGVTMRASKKAEIVVNDGNIFHSGTLLEASEGIIHIGSRNQFGEGGFTAKTNQSGSGIHIGDDGRYLNNPSVFGKTQLQHGSQILGNITVVSCTLSSGGSFRDPDPDQRAGLLKGFGTARDLTVERGHVISAQGIFEPEQMVPQSTFHPKC